MSQMEWIPMESNPEVMTAFIRRLGVKSHIGVVDILGSDDRFLRMVGGQAEGVLLCYPLRRAPEAERADESARQRLYFMRQTIRNACATMALIHVLANRCQESDFEPNSSIKRFISESQQLKPERKATRLEACKSIASAHEQSSGEGVTEAPAAAAPVEYHFVSFICDNGAIYEMDGRKRGPISHGPSSPASFLRDAVAVIGQKFVQFDAAEPDFSMQAVTRAL